MKQKTTKTRYDEGDRLLAELHLNWHGLAPAITSDDWDAKAERCCKLLGIEEGLEANFIEVFVMNTNLTPDLLRKYEAMGFVRDYMDGQRLKARLRLMSNGLLPGLGEQEWTRQARRCCDLLAVSGNRDSFIQQIKRHVTPMDLLDYQRIGAIDLATHRSILLKLLKTREFPQMHGGWFGVLDKYGVLDAKTKAVLRKLYPGCDEPEPRIRPGIKARLTKLAHPTLPEEPPGGQQDQAAEEASPPPDEAGDLAPLVTTEATKGRAGALTRLRQRYQRMAGRF